MDEQDTSSSISQTLMAGAWRGAKFGALIGLAIALLIALASFAVVLFNPVARTHAFDGHPTVLSMIGGTAAGIGLITLYAALAGAVVMGVANVLRRRRG
jgi:hypothetical protein